MKVGDIVQMVTGLPGYTSNPRNNGILIKIEQIAPLGHTPESVSPVHRVATVMSTIGEIMTWQLDSHYEVKVIHESR